MGAGRTLNADPASGGVAAPIHTSVAAPVHSRTLTIAAMASSQVSVLSSSKSLSLARPRAHAVPGENVRVCLCVRDMSVCGGGGSMNVGGGVNVCGGGVWVCGLCVLGDWMTNNGNFGHVVFIGSSSSQ